MFRVGNFKPIVLSTQQALNTILSRDIPLLTTPLNLRLGLGPAQPALGTFCSSYKIDCLMG
jgi:hypothetical protein